MLLYPINVLLGISNVYYNSLAGKYKWKKHRKKKIYLYAKECIGTVHFFLTNAGFTCVSETHMECTF